MEGMTLLIKLHLSISLQRLHKEGTAVNLEMFAKCAGGRRLLSIFSRQGSVKENLQGNTLVNRAIHHLGMPAMKLSQLQHTDLTLGGYDTKQASFSVHPLHDRLSVSSLKSIIITAIYLRQTICFQASRHFQSIAWMKVPVVLSSLPKPQQQLLLFTNS